MKKMMVLLAPFLSVATVAAQTMEYSKEHFLQKSKSQKRAAWILLAGGTSMVLAGSIIGGMDNSEQLGYGANFEVGMWLVGTGLAADLISIPLFVSASKNRRMAVTLNFNNQTQPVFAKRPCPLRFAPGAGVVIRL